MPTFSTLQQFIDSVTARLTKPRRGVNGAEGVRASDVLEAIKDTGKWAEDVRTEAQGLMTNYPNRFSSLSTILYINQATGNDNNTGTISAPIATLQRAAAIANNKFTRAMIVITGNYTHSADADFDLPFLSINYSGTFLAAKRTFAEGEGTSFIRNLGGGIALMGSGTLTIEGHSGPSAGNTISTVSYRNRQGFLRGPLVDYSNSALLYAFLPGLVLGNNTELFSNYWGASEVLEIELRSKLALYGAATLTLGTNAHIGRLMYEFELRRNLLTTTGVWVDVISRDDNILTGGMWSVQVIAATTSAGGLQFDMRWSGTFGWHSGTTNSSNDASVIPLHFMGHARNGHEVQLRTLMTNTAPFGRLQISSNTLTSPSQFIFRFRKLI